MYTNDFSTNPFNAKILPEAVFIIYFYFCAMSIQKKQRPWLPFHVFCKKNPFNGKILPAAVLITGSPPLVRFLLVRISNQYGFLKPKNSTIFLISAVFPTNFEKFERINRNFSEIFLNRFFFQNFLENLQLFSSIMMYFNLFLHQKQKELRLKSNRHTKKSFSSSTFYEKGGLLVS